MWEGVTSLPVERTSAEAPDLAVRPLNLVLYIHPRMFEYSSNIHIGSFVWMDSESILDS